MIPQVHAHPRRLLRHLRRAVTAALTIALSAAAVADAQERGGGIVTRSQAKLVGESWAQLYALPVSENPLFGNGDPCLTLGHNTVEAVAGAHCTVEQGTAVLVGLGSAWSNVESPFPTDEAAQRAVALAADQAITAIHVTVDDNDPIDIRTPRFELFSPQRTVQLPIHNILGVPARSVTLTAHAWSALVRNLHPGPHTIVVDVVWGGERFTFPHFFTVTRARTFQW